MNPFSLLTRTELPPEYRVLIDKFPRAEWGAVHTIGMLGQFWLDRHDGFRQFSAVLDEATDKALEGQVQPGEFAQWFAPRLNHFLGALNGHHQIEDYQYFPLFMAADGRLKGGFELLEEDHHLIHDMLARNASAANDFIRALQSETGEDPRKALEQYALEAKGLLKGLERHLEDEEDLILPLLMEQGEDKFGHY
ncbi:hemerythrin domain-containing protein [Rhizobium sp. L1K21]|uniref:hemerythrin domain-containing protein n=1 Tax=Rhizobium sp. L1K21 TaxID=2954933 RepID=UPI002092F5E5|nr:hemerythrin domain-containing protein [Rhizobium sp. L1K21]MCO6186767.1 hemerythrin domain-containing protein [Rhizobium sp. L1K21]